MRFETSIQMAAPPDRVWAVVTDLERLEDWVTIHRELLEAPPGGLAPGAEFRQRLAVAGQPFDVAWRVERLHAPSHLEWRGRGPFGSNARTAYRLEAVEGGGTRFHYKNEFSLPGGALGRIAGGAVAGRARREADESLERLRDLLAREC